MATHWDRIESPVGELLLTAEDDALTGIWFVSGRHPVSSPEGATRGGAFLARVERELDEYFAGRRREFDLPLAPKGTDFQLRVWDALLHVPFGKTVAYSNIANTIGAPDAVRAVGAANGQNPIPIVIPCHRVIGKDGSLTGYGGGLDVKRYLLKLEGVLVESPMALDLFREQASM